MMNMLFALMVWFAQTALPPAFEVASIKEALPLSVENSQSGRFHVGINLDGSRADYGFMSLADLIPYAHRVKRYQLSGPSWMHETRWDILAKIPPGQPADRAPEMMRNLLAERFKLAIHPDSRVESVYALVVGNGPLKIKEATDTVAPPATGNSAPGFLVSGGIAGTVRVLPGSTGLQMQMPKITMAALADMLTQFMDRPVVDATELKGNYQVTLDLPTDVMTGMPAAQKLTLMLGLGSFGMAPESAGAAMFEVVKALGLELKPRKAPIEMIIVDHLEKTPTAN
jgi:uncharacterized protein (TIGR03435 family)